LVSKSINAVLCVEAAEDLRQPEGGEEEEEGGGEGGDGGDGCSHPRGELAAPHPLAAPSNQVFPQVPVKFYN